MNGTQRFFATPNCVTVCVDGASDYRYRGRLYHYYQREPVEFSDLGQMLLLMEDLFDRLNFPRATTSERLFVQRDSGLEQEEKMEKVTNDQEMSSRRGDLGTFTIRVQHRQNSSWQGRVTWMEENKTLNFRSIWELVKLIENAVDTVDVPREEEPGWFTET